MLMMEDTVSRPARDEGEFSRQAKVVRGLGSPLAAAVLEAGERQLDRAPLTAALVRSWPGDRAEAALAMRFNAAIHAVARRDPATALGALLRRRHDDFDGTIGAVMAAEDAFIAAWMRDPPQTNEVGRAASIVAALMVARQAFGLPFELFELGSSAGLNLNLARYAYDLAGVRTGEPGSHVTIRPRWRGPPPPNAPIEVVGARGVDLNPLDAANAATRERLLAYVFADQPDRARRLEAALTIAQQFPPRIDRADATAWLRDQLATPQPARVCRAVFHSMVLQYLSVADRKRVVAAIEEAGRAASAQRPLAWIRFEWTASRSEVRLLLTCWPDGRTKCLAICHPYGSGIDWQAAPIS
jgi:hypothetical protein